jgi:hypothetical protein
LSERGNAENLCRLSAGRRVRRRADKGPVRRWILQMDLEIYCCLNADAHHLFLFRNYDVLDQKVWAVALCRELPSPAWRGVYRRG